MQTEKLIALEHIKIPAFEKARVLVCGDLMLDRYWYGDTSRISPEAPVPVVLVKNNEARAGGAANVALNVAALGAEVGLMGYVGVDAEAQMLQELVNKKQIAAHFIAQENCPTVTKLRVLGRNQQLIRMDFEEGFAACNADQLIAVFTEQLEHYDVVVLSDYAKGTLACVETLIKLARQKNKLVLIDPKDKNFRRYAGASLITPNRKEFEWLVGPCKDREEIIEKGRAVLQDISIQALLVTLGADGMVLLQNNAEPLHLPARAREVFDVTGAGDTVIATFAASLAAKETFLVAALLANVAAGIVIGKIGAATVSVPELRRGVQRLRGSNLGVLTEEELLIAVADAKAHGEKIVMTNGCFDLLHAGHVEYLEAARSLGDRLIVAVNDDASVQRLKGSSRPINALQERMDVLAALRSVDWVVSFSEETPARLIGEILPDFLVKGEDYKPEQIAGGDAVIEHGGSVQTIKFRPGCSTTKMIEKIQKVEELI